MDLHRGSDASAAALGRVQRAIGGADVVERLADLSGSDFITLMLAVARRRAEAQTPVSVLRRYRSDRFVQPGPAAWRRLRHAEDQLVAGLPAEFEMLTLAPVVPLGAHSALGPVSQDKVISAMRGCEVAADPTNGLALEAAARHAARRGALVRLAAIQRVVRAQPVPAGYLAHFSLLGLVTAGRDEGGHRFERESVVEHVRAIAAGLSAVTAHAIELALTPLTPTGEAIAASVAELLAGVVTVDIDNERRAGRAYYRDLCFKINVRAGGDCIEVGDGGFTDWVARLTASGKERLLISGVGIDRVAALAAEAT